MRNIFTKPLSAGLLAFLAAACSNGSTDTTGSVSIRCADGASFCLISCDLGCNQTGCSVTEIAENQRLRFVFSDRIAPNSVSRSNVSIRTPSGVAPDGDLMVSDRELVFVPSVRTVGGISSFGFQRNETYVITLTSAANGQGIRSASGDGLERDFTCTVIASRGIQDEDQLPPTVTLVSPVVLSPIPSLPTIVLRFSELIDTTPLQGVLSATSPINLIVRRSVSIGGVLVCDTDSAGVALEGSPTLSTERVGANDVTVVQFASPLPLPTSGCLTVTVTADLRDISGRPAVPVVFEMFTAAGAPQVLTISETFATSANQDLATSGTPWSAGARPTALGGDGRHGSFDVKLGALVAPNEYEWNTDSFTIPANRTLSGMQAVVQDGKFYFTDFILPAGSTMRWRGAVAPQIFVRGRVEILGTIKNNGQDLPFWTPTGNNLAAGQRVQDFNARGVAPNGTGNILGQFGSSGGAGGGNGGRGGQECAGNGPLVAYNGQDGTDVRVPGGHAFAGAGITGTGGKGSLLHPPAGFTTTYLPTQMYTGNIRARLSPGGGGGGFSGPGTQAAAPSPVVLPLEVGVAQPAGLGFTLFDFTLYPPTGIPPTATSSLNQFLIGGSGGGGGGSHAFGTLQGSTQLDHWIAGSGGSGGGGAMAFRAGGDIVVGSAARLESKGGGGVLITGDSKDSATQDIHWGVTSPGGGGSGGSYLLQASRTVVCNGTFDTSGGIGSNTGFIGTQTTPLVVPTPAVFNITTRGGDGASGFYRLEAGQTVTFLGTGTPTFDPAVNIGTLTDRDPTSGSASNWRSSLRVFPPKWLRYELEVEAEGDGVITVYTDSGAPLTQKANDPNGPVTILFQGAVLNKAGSAPASGQTPKPWREGIGNGAGPGIGLDSPTGFRFILTFNNVAYPNCIVRALRVYAES